MAPTQTQNQAHPRKLAILAFLGIILLLYSHRQHCFPILSHTAALELRLGAYELHLDSNEYT
jgi:hypothetical protein